MPGLVVLGVLALAILFHLPRRQRGSPAGHGDLPARVVGVAAKGLLSSRREWALAMAAELPHVHGRGRRWQFAAGVLRVAMFPPASRPRRALAVAVSGLAATAVLTAIASAAAPAASLFVPLLGLLLCGYAAAVAGRPRHGQPSVPYAVTAFLALAAAAASVACVIWLAAAHPAAVTGQRSAFSVVLALAIAGYLAVALTPPAGGEPAAMLWWGLGGALACAAIYAAAAIVQGGVPALVAPMAVTLTVGYGAAARAGGRLAGARAGLLAAALGALIHFAVDAVVLLSVPAAALATSYDITQFHRSGAPDLASYVIGDALGGAVLGGMLIYPVAVTAAALLGSAAGAARPAFGSHEITR